MVARVDSKSILPSEGLGVGSIPTRVTTLIHLKMDTKLFKDLYQANIDEIKAIEQLSIDHNMLDNGYYLTWKDNLNKLSIDIDRVTHL